MISGIDKTRPVSLYVHVPFCKRKCDYCAFYSVPESELIEGYFRTAKKQIVEVATFLGKPFETVYFGGGNPGLLGAKKLSELVDAASIFGKSKECTFEVNPETLDESFSLLFDRVTRVSMGVQSFSQSVLKALGRNANEEETIRGAKLLSELKSRYGIEISADLICCVPGFPASVHAKDIDILSSLGFDHISLYSLTFEKGAPICSRLKELGGDEEADILSSLWLKLKGLGYDHYEISNFAAHGKCSKHNLAYWRLGQYVGVGPGAESSAGYGSVVSARIAPSVAEYIGNPAFVEEKLTRGEAMEEMLIMSLRTKWGIDKKEWGRRFDVSFDKLFSSSIGRLPKGTYVDDESSFSLTEEGMMTLDGAILALAMAID